MSKRNQEPTVADCERPFEQRLRVLGMKTSIVAYPEVLEWMRQMLERRTAAPVVIVHLNLHNLYRLQARPELQKRLDTEAWTFLEGIGLKAAGFIQHRKILPDINGTDLFPGLMDAMQGNEIRVFLLGAEHAIVQKAAADIVRRWPYAHITGCQHGFFKDVDKEAICRKINQGNTDILLVGLGCPYQEQVAIEWAKDLNVKVIWNVGGLLDFLAGAKPRAPKVLRTMRLEWLYRFCLEPTRMWKRIFLEPSWLLMRCLKTGIFTPEEEEYAKNWHGTDA